MDLLNINLILLFLSLFMQLLGLIFVVADDHYFARTQRVILFLIDLCVLMLVIQNYLDYMFSDQWSNIQLRTAAAAFGYILRPLILILFINLIYNNKRILRYLWILIWINTAVYVTPFFSSVAFYINSENSFVSGPLKNTCLVISLILLVILFYISVHSFRRDKRGPAAIPVFIALMVLGGLIMDMHVSVLNYVSFLTVTIVCGSTFYTIWLQMQYVRSYEDNVRAEQRIQLMMSQIQPHFLFNTLSTIQALCLIDPEKASSTTEKFGTYLRQNIDSMSQTELIPAEKELEHTKIYSDIEMIRFPRIRVVYNVLDSDFKLPALTIQPLVENAIRHGIRIRENGLVTVQVSACEDSGHEIIIRDNGKGFDVEEALSADESHIGLRNVKSRIEQMCGGKLTIQSAPGKGAVLTIYIPEQKADK